MSDDKTADKTWDWLIGLVTDGIEANSIRAAESALNRLTLSGETDVAYSLSRGVIRTKPPRGRHRVKDDRLFGHYRWLRRKLFKNKPTLTAHAGGAEIIDAHRAQVAERVFDYWRTNNGWREAEEEAYRWVFSGGRAFLEVVWQENPLRRKAKRKLVFREQPVERVSDGKRRRTFIDEETEEVFEGDLAFRVWDPDATFLFPVTAREWKYVQQIVTVDLVGHSYLEQYLGTPIGEDTLLAAEEGKIRWDVIESINRYAGSGWSIPTTDRSEKRYLLVQLRERPTFARPEGRWIIAVGGRVIVDEGLPYLDEVREIDPNDVHNLTMGVVPWFSERIAGALLPPAPATILRRKQAIIDDLMSDIRQNRKEVARNKILAAKGMFEDEKWTDENGQILHYNRVGQDKPTMVQGQPLAGAMTELEDARRSFDESAGRPSVLRGDNPPQVRSAFHFEMLYEEASELLALDVQTRERVHEMCGRIGLAVARRRMDEDRVVEIYGAERASHAIEFMRTNIRSDLRIQEGSAMARNHAAIQATAVELYRYNAILKPDGTPDADALWEILQLGQINPSVQSRQRHRASAENVFTRMLYKGEFVYPQAWEEHPVYIEVFRHLMDTPEFRNAPEDRRAAIIAHLRMRTAVLAMQLGGTTASPSAPAPGLDTALEDTAGRSPGEGAAGPTV